MYRVSLQNYTAGLPNATLYVKNIAKEVTEDDLRFVFGESNKVSQVMAAWEGRSSRCLKQPCQCHCVGHERADEAMVDGVRLMFGESMQVNVSYVCRKGASGWILLSPTLVL